MSLSLDLYSRPPPPFGHQLRKYFEFDDYTSLNHGAYGTTPTPVLQATIALLHKAESNADFWNILYYQAKLAESRAELAKLLNVDPAEIVLVPNATTGLNVIMRNFEWKKGDVIFTFTTSYAAANNTATYLSEVPPHPTKSIVVLNFPTTRELIIEGFRNHLKLPESQAASKDNKRVAIIDSISSHPGMHMPWKELVRIAKEEGVWTVVDGAHSLGQEVDIDLPGVQPDFWVTSTHKWLYVKRTAAALYIPIRNQHIIKSSVPTSNFYIPLSQRNGDPNIQAQFEWTGTTDFTPYLTIPDALKFRKWLGGEKVINKYTHDLAVQGGRYLSQLWNTTNMDPSGSMTLNMANVELPVPADLIPEFQLKRTAIITKLMTHYKVYAAPYIHNGRLWTRAGAQTYNELSDFKKLGRAWLEIAEDLKNNKF